LLYQLNAIKHGEGENAMQRIAHRASLIRSASTSRTVGFGAPEGGGDHTLELAAQSGSLIPRRPSTSRADDEESDSDSESSLSSSSHETYIQAAHPRAQTEVRVSAADNQPFNVFEFEKDPLHVPPFLEMTSFADNDYQIRDESES
jgi:hypothetical protein